VAELQREANERLETRLDLSRETIGKRLRIASRLAERQENPAALAQCELGMAKVFHRLDQPTNTQTDYNSAQSMADIGRKLLQSIGFASPDDVSIRRAVEANDVFVDTLQAIYQDAQALTLEQQ
jgi:hypothetical protein